MAGLAVGDQAPDFEAHRPDGSHVTLAELRGNYILVYFYPKDFTGGCTAEACSLNEAGDDFSASGALVIGVSGQDKASHKKFQAKHGLKFALAADTDRAIADAYGVGRTFGILPLHARDSFLVAPDGSVIKIWRSVNPGKHAAEVLEAVRAASTAPAS